MNYDKIGLFIAKKRKEKNLTQKDLALKLSVTDKAVSKWERGLGCPDVSILELLANILDVSILEILKGRMIENEVIQVTELNDYVLDTVMYSKHQLNSKTKKIINQIIIFLIIGICSFLLIVNINHIFYLNRTGTCNDCEETNTKTKNNLNNVEKNLDKLKLNQGKYSKEDYDKLITYIEKNLDILSRNEVLKISNSKMNIKQVNKISVQRINKYYLNMMYNILLNYDISVKDSSISIYLDFDYSINYDNYLYKYKLIELIEEESDTNINNKINNIIFGLNYYSEILDETVKKIIEVGDINE